MAVVSARHGPGSVMDLSGPHRSGAVYSLPRRGSATAVVAPFSRLWENLGETGSAPAR